MAGMNRFVALDSCRGLAACWIALLHFEAYSHLLGTPILSGAFFAVDFFFVLSGFVIAANYQRRLLEGFGAGRFMVLRLGRIYPLHFAMLALGVGIKLIELSIPSASSITDAAAHAPFSSPNEAPGTIVANLLLVQSLHVYDFLSWNAQSWSISTEFYTYILFAVCLLALRERGWIVLLAAMVGGPVAIAILSRAGLDTTYDWGMIRCVYGFSAGVIAWNVYDRWGGELRGWLSGSVAEWSVIAVMLVFVVVAGHSALSIAAPYVFALAVLIFAFEGGSASAILKLRPLVFVGTISYSIYMTHVFVARRFFDAGRVLYKVAHIDVFTHLKEYLPYGHYLDLMGPDRWQGDIANVVFLATVIAVSAFTYRWIEKPGRDWVRDRIQARDRVAGSRETVGA
jgi:peptidoglycan/LPS O-acetylase OafA/YrhL